MVWWKNKSETTDDKKNDKDDIRNGALVRQDPRTKVKTTSAATATTNTYVQNATIVNSNTNKVTYRSTQQTVTHTQQARVTEIVTRRTPTIQELQELLAQANLDGKDFGAGQTGRANRSNSRPPKLNEVGLRHTTSFKRTSTGSPLSPLAFQFETPPDGAKRNSTVVKTEKTTVTQKNGRTVTQRVEEQRIKLKPTGTYSSYRNGTGFKSTYTATSSTAGAGGGFSYADAKPAATNSLAKLTWLGSATPTTTQTTITSYKSPYEKRSLNGGTVYTSASTSALPKTTSSSTTTNKFTNVLPSLSTGAVPKYSSNYNSSSFAKTQPSPRLSTVSNTSSASSINSLNAPLSNNKSATTTANLKPLSSTKNKSKLKPAHVYIFNHEKFDNPQNEFRAGSSVDEKTLDSVFKQYKCKVTIIKNGTVGKVAETVRKIQTKDFSDVSCVVIVILSHGSRHDMIAAKDGDYSIDDDMLFPILNNTSLKNKPKFFFVQACKGSMEVGKFSKDATKPVAAPVEIYKCYSTFEGYASYRTTEGSIFIQAFCERLKRDGSSKDIRNIMAEVTAAVKQQSQDKQVPTITGNLTQGYVFGDYV